ncbi:MAG: D-alanine--D-alanine ligase [Christensenellaceae bacterium]|jgi:D-alanine-D-alanine ligase|nr:D-alanine--D-alanine ligase [Christensenellaceae bacterium]
MLNLAVVYGSRACEHDVSIVTALQAMDNADAAKYNIIPLYIAKDGRWFTGDALRRIEFYRDFDEKKAVECRLAPQKGGKGVLLRWPEKKGFFGGGGGEIAVIDAALCALHGLNGEDGTIQGLFELYDIPYTSAGVLGSSAGMDKIAMKLLYKGLGLPVLDMVWFLRQDFFESPGERIAEIEAAFGYPCYVKPANLGSSIGISKATDRESLKNAIEVAASYDKRILVERGVENAKEVNCSALGYGSEVRASLCEMPVSWESFLTFEDKYLRGGKGEKGQKGQKAGSGMASLQRQLPAPIGEEKTKRIQELTCKMFKAMDLKGVVRVDFIIDASSDEVFVNEVNTIPGSLAFYLWEPLGMSYRTLIDELVRYAFAAQKDKEASAFSFDSSILEKANLGGAKK